MFSSSFWESDFVSQTGFDTLVARMKEGRQTCRDVEDFIKQRAKAEEEYAKALLKIAKVERGNDETGTMKNSLKTLQREAEAEASIHLNHSQALQDQVKKLEEFREKQREERKRHEDAMHKAHKLKAEAYRRMQVCKGVYESKFKSAEKAESDLERIKFGNKPKEIDKAKKTAQQSKQASVKANEEYHSTVTQLEIIRQSWELDHRTACDIFQRLEEERLQCLRNELWVFANLGSDLFVKSDDISENIRLSLENCDIDSDICDFVSRKSTGTQPLTPIVYQACGGSTNGNVTRQAPNFDNRDSEYSLASYASINTSSPAGSGNKMFVALFEYAPRISNEIELIVGDKLICIEEGNDGWIQGRNIRTGESGLFPASYVKAE
uniref:proline-serine-threonine phosphatase-interacting protein 1-like n=1 Tax=Styela clava TaxID=7725 RepID=UPI00193A10F4|nr:proline-serine-threonine phosphatase-interacting protein 1-like [Styela clava]